MGARIDHSNGPSLVKKVVVLKPAGAAGSAAATYQLNLPGPGVLKAIHVDYGSAVPSTTDLTIKRNTSAGAAVFTATNCNTDIGGTIPANIVTDGVDEANGATADNSPGQPFSTGLYISVAQADASIAGGTKDIIVELWIEMARYLHRQVTIKPSGADGSATGDWNLYTARPGVLRFLSVNYGASVPSTTDVTIKDWKTANTLFTATNCNTDIGPCSVTTDAVDESNGTVADLGAAGLPFTNGLKFHVAQADASVAGGSKDIVVDYWIQV